MQLDPINFNDTSIAFSHLPNRRLKNAQLLFRLIGNHWLTKVAKLFLKGALKLNLPIIPLINNTVFKQFCGGESIKDSMETISLLKSYNIETILGYSVEWSSNEEAYNLARDETIREIKTMESDTNIAFCQMKLSAFGSIEIMTKVQAKESLNEDEKYSLQCMKERIKSIIEVAHQVNRPVMIDAEESWFQEYMDELVNGLMRDYNKKGALIYNTYQMYKYDSLQKLSEDIIKAKKGGYYFGAKLVRGAYVEKERIRAAQYGYSSPIHANKTLVDQDYDRALKLCLNHIDFSHICAGTHNEFSCKYLTELMKEMNLENNDKRIYFAQLLGMSDNISFKLSSMKYNVAKYVPYGPIKEVLPYLFRRAEENTSISGQSSREYVLITKELKRRKKLQKKS